MARFLSILWMVAGFLVSPEMVRGAPPNPSRLQVVGPNNVIARDTNVVIRSLQDGALSAGKVNGEVCLQLNTGIGNTGNQRYLYADVDREFLQNATGGVQVIVSWLGQSMPALEYDSLDRRLPLGGKYKSAFSRDVTGATASWNLAAFWLPDPQFYDRLNGPADLRLIAEDPMVTLEISLRRGVSMPAWETVSPVPGREAFIQFGTGSTAVGLSRLPDSPRMNGPGSETAQGLSIVASGTPHAAYVSLAVEDSFWHASSGTAELAVEYLDLGARRLIARYDSAIPGDPYRAAPPIGTRDLGNGWKRTFFSLDDVLFANRQNFGGDLRVGVIGAMCVRQITVRRGAKRVLGFNQAQRIVRHLYFRFLQRQPSPREEKLYCRALLTGGLSPRELIRKLAYSREYQEQFFHSIRFEKAINHLARLILERKLSPDEQLLLVGYFGDRRFDQIVDSLLDSGEIRLTRGEYVVPGLD